MAELSRDAYLLKGFNRMAEVEPPEQGATSLPLIVVETTPNSNIYELWTKDDNNIPHLLSGSGSGGSIFLKITKTWQDFLNGVNPISVIQLMTLPLGYKLVGFTSVIRESFDGVGLSSIDSVVGTIGTPDKYTPIESQDLGKGIDTFYDEENNIIESYGNDTAVKIKMTIGTGNTEDLTTGIIDYYIEIQNKNY